MRFPVSGVAFVGFLIKAVSQFPEFGLGMDLRHFSYTFISSLWPPHPYHQRMTISLLVRV